MGAENTELLSKKHQFNPQVGLELVRYHHDALFPGGIFAATYD